MEMFKDAEVRPFVDVAEWEAWLAKHYEHQPGIWIKIARKATGLPTVTHAEALDVALCYGWIDGQRRSLDDTHFLQKFTPRRKRSLWSKVNIEKVTALIAAGKMQPSGQAEIDAAKADGRWAVAYESQANAKVPPDLQAVLDADPKSKEFFESLNKANKYAFIWRLMTAPSPQKRAERLAKMADMLARAEAFH